MDYWLYLPTIAMPFIWRSLYISEHYMKCTTKCDIEERTTLYTKENATRKGLVKSDSSRDKRKRVEDPSPKRLRPTYEEEIEER